MLKSNKTQSMVLTLILFGGVSFAAYAQKLPKVQRVNKRAPANIKIDGNTVEWDDQFQAYNPNNRIYYIIANDDNNLYLALRAVDPSGNEKAIFGITFTVKWPGEKGHKSKGNISVTFPTNIEVSKRNPIRYTVHIFNLLKTDTTNTARKKTDSLRLLVNDKMNEAFKIINVMGIPEIQEPSISIYNQQGIQVAAQFNKQAQYTYELAIPLKYLGDVINSGQKFSYNIKMNGIPEVATNGAPTPMIVGPINAAPNQGGVGIDNGYILYPTDFSGEYALAK